MTSIVQFSDIHFGVEDQQAISAVRSYCEKLSPDVILICGDITQDGKTVEFKAARNWIKTFSAPKVITPGNHDTPVYGIFQRIFNPFGRYKKYIKPLSKASFTDENITIVPYNTARGVQARLDWSLGVVNLNLFKKLTERLSASGGDRLKMIALHHPLIYPAVSPLQKETKNGEAAVTMLCDANIDAVLSGHVHAPFVVAQSSGENPLLSIGSGTLSTRMRGKPASFNHIEIDKLRISVTAVDWVDGKFVRQETWSKLRRDLQEGTV